MAVFLYGYDKEADLLVPSLFHQSRGEEGEYLCWTPSPVAHHQGGHHPVDSTAPREKLPETFKEHGEGIATTGVYSRRG